jgi:hypothetical protein
MVFREIIFVFFFWEPYETIHALCEQNAVY